MGESIYVLIFCRVVLSGGVYVFELVEMDLCYLQFSFLYVNADWYIFGRVRYVVLYQCDEAPSCFVASILS